MVLLEILQTPLPECFTSNRSSKALTARQRKQPGLRTAMITAPFFSHSSFALNILGYFSSISMSVSSKYSSAAFWVLDRDMSVLARSRAPTVPAPMDHISMVKKLGSCAPRTHPPRTSLAPYAAPADSGASCLFVLCSAALRARGIKQLWKN